MIAKAIQQFLLSPFQWLTARFRDWADQRSPRSSRVQLNQRRIYIVPTGSGFFWLSMVLVIFLVAVNYSNSLAYGLCFFMLSLFLLSILHTWRNLAGITLVARRAKAGFSGEIIDVVVECLNDHRARYSIGLGWPDTEVVLVSFQKDCEQTLVARTGRRGWFKPGRMRIESIYPLGLCRAWSWVRLDFNSVVYPVPDDRYPLPENQSADDGERSVVNSGFDDFAGFKNYQETDNPAHVYWKAYARTGELLTKQFEQPSGRELCFSLNQVSGHHLEQQLSILTAWCLRCEQLHFTYGLMLPGHKLVPSLGADHLRRCLEVLALYHLEDDEISRRVNGIEKEQGGK